ncbi:MAG: protein kinase domain-containing protein [Phycisphaerales bacterium]
MTPPPERIGPYTIVRELGRGGMGVVYLATDTRLERAVAIKALPAELASDPARLERFEREAKTLAQLNHPNLAGIYGVEEQDGAKYLVLEFVEGETLADRLDRGPLPIDEAIEYAVQIAAGVEAAHEAGVIHRDLKPANIIVTPDGQAKVLDFGLARTDDGGQSSSGALDSPTMTTPQPQHSPTIAGAILGTAAYMSPEQARGRRVDKRTDIWSFGVLLYEMLIGASPFHGETATDSIGAVLHKDLDLDRLPSATPANVRRVLARCLVRDRNLRYRDIGDVRVELLTADPTPISEPADATERGRLSILLLFAAAMIVALAGLSIWSFSRSASPPEESAMRLTIATPHETSLRLSGDLGGPAVVSHDGTRVAFVAMREGDSRRVWLRDLGTAEAVELEGTDQAIFPFWSPDGRHIGFFTPTGLKRHDTVSGTTSRITGGGHGRGAAWTEDGRIVFAPRFRGGLFVVNAEGGDSQPFTVLDEKLHTSHRWPVVIPGTDKFLYLAVSARPNEKDNNGVYLASLSDPKNSVRVMTGDYGAAYANGHLLFVRDGALLARPFDPVSGSFAGDSSLLARDVHPDISTWHGQFSVSPAGVIVYGAILPASRSDSSVDQSYSFEMAGDRVTAFDYDGRETTAYAIDTPIRYMAQNRSGEMLAVEQIGDDGFIDLWLHPTRFVVDLDNVDPGKAASFDPRPRRFTSLPGVEAAPTWSPDGTEIAFRWDGDESRPRGIYRKRIGEGSVTLVYDNVGGDDHPVDWTMDGKYLIVVSGTLLISEYNDIWAVPLDGGERIPLVTDPGVDVGGRVSMDGRWLAYTRIEDGRWELRVIPFAPAWPEHLRERQWVISEDTGNQPRWDTAGDELFFVDQNADLLAVDVDTTGESFVFSSPRVLFRSPWDVGRSFAATPNRVGGGNHFHFVDSSSEGETPISVILNWTSLLSRP